MKHVLKLTLVMVFALGLFAFTSVTEPAPFEKIENTVDRKLPVMTFNKQMHDFGTIKEGDVVSTTFEFTNSGKAPLVIVSMKGSCGCTVANDWPKEPIPVGGKGSFTVKFNSKGKPNMQQKNITIVANTEKGREVVKIKANVKPSSTK